MSQIGHNNPPPEAFNLKLNPFIFMAEDERVATVTEFIAECGDLDQMTAAQIAHLYSHVKHEFDRLNELRDQMSKFVELMKNNKIPEAFDREKITTFTLQDGTRVTKSKRTTCSILDKEAAIIWLRENGYEDVPQLTINAQTMGSVANEILANVPEPIKNDAGEIIGYSEVDGPSDLPDDIFKVSINPTTSITRKK